MDEKCIPTGLDIYCNLEEKKIKISPHLKSGSDPGGFRDVPPTSDVRREMAKLLYISNNILNEIKFDYSHCQSPTLTRLDYGFDGGISSIKKLEKISFTNCNFDYSGLKPPIYHHNCVKRLEFQNCKLSEEFLALLSNSYPLLQSVNFHDCWQTFYGSRRSKIYLPNTHVDSINLVEEIDDDGRRKSLNRKHNEMLLTVECGSKAKYYYHLFHLDSGAAFKQIDWQAFFNMPPAIDIVDICAVYQ